MTLRYFLIRNSDPKATLSYILSFGGHPPEGVPGEQKILDTNITTPGGEWWTKLPINEGSVVEFYVEAASNLDQVVQFLESRRGPGEWSYFSFPVIQPSQSEEAREYTKSISDCEKEFWKQVKAVPTQKIAQGAEGTIWLACASEGCEFVMKIEHHRCLPGELAECLAKMAREFKFSTLAAQLGVGPPVYATGSCQVSGELWYYIFQQFIRGQTILEMDAPQPKHVVEALELYMRLRQNGVVHGDFHSRNVLVDRQDRVYIIDYGLAREIETKENLAYKAAEAAVNLIFDLVGGRIDAAESQSSEKKKTERKKNTELLADILVAVNAWYRKTFGTELVERLRRIYKDTFRLVNPDREVITQRPDAFEDPLGFLGW